MNKKFPEQISPALRELERRTPIRRESREDTRRIGVRRAGAREAQAISRRAALGRLSAGALLAMGLWPGALRAAEAGGGRSFRFIVVNDTHAVSPECGPFLDGLAKQMKKEEADFVLHGGDVTDKGDKPYFDMIQEAFRAVGKPWYPVIGNHDYVTQTDRKPYEEAFPKRINYAFTEGGWQFVALDTCDGLKYEKTEVQPATFQWLEENLKRLDKRKPTVVLTHFPLGADVRMRPANADALLERFLDFNLQAVFCGHYHGFTEKLAKDVPITTNKCCALKRGNHDGTKEKGYFVCDARDGKLTRRFVEYKPLPLVPRAAAA